MLNSRVVRTLSHYFAARYLGLFAAILTGSTLTISMLEIALNFDEMLGADGGASDVIGYLLLRVPSYYLPQLIPLSAFAAAFCCFGIASRWGEVIALQASGISPPRAVLSTLAAAALLAVFTYALDDIWITRSAFGWNQRQRADDEQLRFVQGGFWYHKGGTLYRIGGTDSETRTLWQVEIFERDPRGHLIRQITCERVRVDAGGSWHLAHAISRRFDPAQPQAPPRVDPDTNLELEVSRDRDLLLHRDDATGLRIAELRQYIETLRHSESPGTEASLARLETLLHHRLSAPFLIIIFTLLAIPAALRVPPGGNLAPPALVAAGIIAVFSLFRNLGSSLASEAIVPPLVAPWSILLIFTVYGGWALWRARA